MITYAEQREIVSRYSVVNGQNLRVNCPNCGGNKTLSVSKFDGKLVWQCFKASCDFGGRSNVGRTRDELRTVLSGQTITFERKSKPIPAIVGKPENYPAVMAYLKNVNSYEAYSTGLLRIEYAPAENRVLFFNPSQEGRVGRSMTKGLTPKWKVFGDTSELFHVGTSKSAVVVEDAASACAVAATNKWTDVALLGTRMNHEQKRTFLVRFNNLTIALDKDASRKALTLLQELRVLVKCTIKIMQEDPKQYSANQLMEILNETESDHAGRP